MRMSVADYKALNKNPKPTVQQRMQALGRLPKGTMNKTEQRYANRLDAKKLSGEILWYEFEAIKLMLAPNTSLTVDFMVMSASGLLEAHDVKAAKNLITDDARAKMKIAAAKFPFLFCYAYPESKSSHNWVVQEI